MGVSTASPASPAKPSGRHSAAGRRPHVVLPSHHVRPAGTIGAKRVERIACELAERGWRVTVVTPRAEFASPRDDSLGDSLPGVTVLRVGTAAPRSWAKRSPGQGASEPAAASTPAPPNAAPPAAARRQLRTLIRGLVGRAGRAVDTWLEVPDAYAGWAPAVLAAVRERPDLVVSSVPWFSDGLTAGLLARRWQCPLLLDFRDPWDPHRHRAGRPLLRRGLEESLERRLIAQARGLVTVTEGIAADLRARFGRQVDVIPNACEPETFAAVTPRDFGRPTLLYVGGLYGGRRYDVVLRALAAARDAGAVTPAQLGLHYMGLQGDGLQALTAELDLGDFVTWEGNRPWSEALAAMKGADCNLLLVAARHVRQVPGKLFEQLSAGRPMFVVAPPGADASALLAGQPDVDVVAPDDAGAVRAALDAVIARGRVPQREAPEIPSHLTVSATMDAFDAACRAALDVT